MIDALNRLSNHMLAISGWILVIFVVVAGYFNDKPLLEVATLVTTGLAMVAVGKIYMLCEERP